MLPGAPGHLPTSTSNGQFRPGQASSQKEEVARAALRSLAGPVALSEPSIASHVPTYPRFSQPALVGAHAQLDMVGHASRPFDQTSRDFRADSYPGHVHGAPRRGPPYDEHAGGSSMELDDDPAHAGDRDHRSMSSVPIGSDAIGGGSYFGLPSLTASPRLHDDGNLPPPLEADRYPRDTPSLSISSSASTPNYEVAAASSEDREAVPRRTAASLRVSYDDVRCIAEQVHYAQPVTRYAPASGSFTAGAAQRVDSATAKRILDALRAEDERSLRIGGFRDAYVHQERHREKTDLRPQPPPGQVWASDRNVQHGPRQRQPHHVVGGGGGIHARDDRRRSHHEGYGVLAGPSPKENYRSILAGSASPRLSIAGDTVLSASPRSSSPSPFAFDPPRQPSLPPISAMTLHDPAPDCSLFDSGGGSPRQWWVSGGIRVGSEGVSSPSLGSYRSGFHAARKGRSIDDYLESSSSVFTSAGGRMRRPSQPRDILPTLLPSSELEGASPSPVSSRHPYQPYPPASSQYQNPLQLTQTRSWSPSASPALMESPTHHPSGLPRRSPAALGPSASSFRGYPSHGNVAGFTPSPLLGGREQNLWDSPSVKSEASERSRFHDGGDEPDDGDLERGNAIFTDRKAVQADEAAAPAVAKKSRARAARARTLVAAASPSSVSEVPPSPAGPLSREDIMKRLQDKVKARIAAKAASSDGVAPEAVAEAGEGFAPVRGADSRQKPRAQPKAAPGAKAKASKP